MEKITWSQMCERMCSYNHEHGYTRKGNPTDIKAVVVFTGKGMKPGLTEIERSYIFSSDNKYFLSDQIGNSIFADCLDKTESGVRIDWYIHEWEVDYCYIVEE